MPYFVRFVQKISLRISTPASVVPNFQQLSFQEIGVAESNSDVRILIGSSKIAVCGMRSTNLAKNSPERLERLCVWPSSCNAMPLPRFLVHKFILPFLEAVYDVTSNHH